jgi:hypothetical protein
MTRPYVFLSRDLLKDPEARAVIEKWERAGFAELMDDAGPVKFNGPDYDPQLDNERLSQQHARIRDLMLDARWRTLSEIAYATGYSTASISAQLRHLRKPRFGGYTVEKQSIGCRLFAYRVRPTQQEEIAS